LQAQSLQHDSLAGILASVEAGTGVAIGMDVFGYSFGNRVKVLDLIPEPKPISIGVAALKGKLSPAAKKFWQCAKEAVAAK
jgi:DNA-binding transcriptional LysR family regulator